MEVELKLVPVDQKKELAGLMDVYLKEHHQFKQLAKGPESTKDYIYFDAYWEEAGRYPFFIYSENNCAGFVLVRTVNSIESVFYQVSEFYIIPECRLSGLGRRAIEQVWHEFPGDWELDVVKNNHAARQFWSQCCEQFSKGRVTVEEVQAEDGAHFRYNFSV